MKGRRQLALGEFHSEALKTVSRDIAQRGAGCRQAVLNGGSKWRMTTPIGPDANFAI